MAESLTERSVHSLVERIRRFNRKERYFVVKTALGDRASRLDPAFISQLSTAFGLEIPDEAYWAFDYHLDWLYAATRDWTLGKQTYDNANRGVAGNQEDIDLLIAFDDGMQTNIILLEAKGVTGWSNSQLASKVQRLTTTFGVDGKLVDGTTPHFGIMSPRRPDVQTLGWGEWMLHARSPVWIPMDLPKDLVHVSRCDASGASSAAGTFWTVRSQ